MKNSPDEIFEKINERLIKGAEYLENPLITKEDRAKGMKLYDQLCEELERYRHAS